jgi:hypothetical protein
MTAPRPTAVMMSVAGEFKPPSAGETLASTPTAMLSPSGWTEVAAAKLAASERRAIAPRSPHATVAAALNRVLTNTVLTKGASTKGVGTRPALPATTDAAAPTRFTGSRPRFPGNLAIWTAIAPSRAAFAAILPIAVARRALVYRVPPFRPVAFIAIARTAAPDHPFLVLTLVAPTDATRFVSVVVACRVTLRTFPFANGSIGRLADSASGARGPVFVKPGIRSALVARIGHFVRSHLLGGTGTPIPLGDELHYRRRRNSSKKHQRVAAHQNFLDTFECRSILRIDAVTDLETSPAPAPYGRFSSAVESHDKARNLN